MNSSHISTTHNCVTTTKTMIAYGLSGSSISLLLVPELAVRYGSFSIFLVVIALLLTWGAIFAWSHLVLQQPDKKGGIVAAAATLVYPFMPSFATFLGVGAWLTRGFVAAWALRTLTAAIANLFPLSSSVFVGIIVLIVVCVLFTCYSSWIPRIAFYNAILSLSSVLLVLAMSAIDSGVSLERLSAFKFIVPDSTFVSILFTMSELFLMSLFAIFTLENSLCFVSENPHGISGVKNGLNAIFFLSLFYYIVVPFGLLATDQIGTRATPIYNVMMIFNSMAIMIGCFSSMQSSIKQHLHDGTLAMDVECCFKTSERYGMTLFITVVCFYLKGYNNLIVMAVVFAASMFMSIGMNAIVWQLRKSGNTSLYTNKLDPIPLDTSLFALIHALACGVSFILGYHMFGLTSINIGLLSIGLLLSIYSIGRHSFELGVNEVKLYNSMFFKLTCPMFFVIELNSISYSIIIRDLLSQNYHTLANIIFSVFTLVSFSILFMAILIPQMIKLAAQGVSVVTHQLVTGPLHKFTNAMLALGSGDLKAAYVHFDYQPIMPLANDELGRMAMSLNTLQMNLIGAIDGMNRSRDSLSAVQNGLEETNIYLEKRVKERTNELQKTSVDLEYALDNLKQFQAKLAEIEKSSAIGSLVAGVAHEINTPLGICVSAVSQLNSEFNKVIASVEGNAFSKSGLENFMSMLNESYDIIRDNLIRSEKCIISFNNVADTESNEEIKEFNLQKILQQIATSLSPLMKGTPLKMRIECPSDIILEGYTGPLFQIMTILVTNAMTHAFKAEQPGEILLLGQIEPDNSVSISCIDNGLGVPPDIVNRIFDMFFTTRGGAGGVGLGLHIAQNLAVQMFHGTLTCKSTLGKGSQFILHFPGTGLRSSTTTDLPSQPSGAKPDQTKGGG